jgi:predicted TIM-barrel fold metal-dependent hydrolase
LFPLLAHYGWARPFRDERGWLIRRHENVAFIVDEVADAFE